MGEAAQLPYMPCLRRLSCLGCFLHACVAVAAIALMWLRQRRRLEERRLPFNIQERRPPWHLQGKALLSSAPVAAGLLALHVEAQPAAPLQQLHLLQVVQHGLPIHRGSRSRPLGHRQLKRPLNAREWARVYRLNRRVAQQPPESNARANGLIQSERREAAQV
eukprot:scaffold38071_cov107-Isochrysis_galbana.AAC.4